MSQTTTAQKSVPFDVLTPELLDRLPAQEIFATGILLDNEYGINMTGSGKPLRWVAVTGAIGDWAIYCYWSWFSPTSVKTDGDKVFARRYIENCILVDDAAFARYRR